MGRWSQSAHSFARANVRSLSTIHNNEMFRKRFAFDFARFSANFFLSQSFDFSRAFSRKSFLMLFLDRMHVFALKLD